MEHGWRLAGSGFIDHAIWSELISLDTGRADQTPTSAPHKSVMKTESISDGPDAVGVMDRIKTILSEHMGVRPQQIDIEVRIKL